MSNVHRLRPLTVTDAVAMRMTDEQIRDRRDRDRLLMMLDQVLDFGATPPKGASPETLMYALMFAGALRGDLDIPAGPTYPDGEGAA